MPTARFQPSFAGGVLGPGLHGRIDQSKYDVGLKVGENVFIHAHGGVSNRAGFEFCGEVMDHAVKHRLIPFERDDDENYVIVMGDSEMQIMQDGAYLETSPGVTYNPSTPYSEAMLPALSYAQSIDVMYFAHQSVYPQKMSRTGATSWSFANVGISPAVAAAPTPVITTSHAEGRIWHYVISGVTDGVEGFIGTAGTISNGADLTLAGRFNNITWTTVNGHDEYRVYRYRNGIWAYIGFTSGQPTPTAVQFTDDNISPDLTVTPIEGPQVFLTGSDYPAVVTLYQQRLVYANSVNQPETIWMSRVGDFENFTKSRILLPDDRIELDITGASINKIRGITQLRELLVFTGNGEFSVSGPDGVMVATNPVQTQYGYAGTTGLKPLIIEDTLLFVDRTGRQVRDFRYAFEQDGYSGNDLTIWANHFFEGREIVDWAYCRNPFSIVWVVLDDGTLLSLTYKREHQVWAWTEHVIDGLVESVTSVRENAEDRLYAIIRRTVGGAQVRYVERLRSRDFTDVADFFGVDSGVTYSGTATTTIGGLWHLEGREVVALSEGAVVSGLTVSSGQVTLPVATTKAHVGLAYTAEIETLPPPIELKDVGSARGRPVKASAAYVQLEKTRGVTVASTGRRFAPLIQPTDDLAVPGAAYTGMEKVQLYPDWNLDGTIVIRQTNPLPMTVLGISPEYTVGRTQQNG